jgi:hypothetical protein
MHKTIAFVAASGMIFGTVWTGVSFARPSHVTSLGRERPTGADTEAHVDSSSHEACTEELGATCACGCIHTAENCIDGSCCHIGDVWGTCSGKACVPK